MKLFTSTDKITLPLESYRQYFISSSYIANEDLVDYFYKIKDIFTESIDKITFAYNNKMTYDILEDRHYFFHSLKKVKFTDIASLYISKPENFKGYYLDYFNDLVLQIEEQMSTVFASIEKVKYFISYYINEYKSDVFDVNSSLNYFKSIEKDIETTYKNISSYFKANDHTTKTEFKRVYRTFSDFEGIYKLIETLDKRNIDSNIKLIEKESKSCSELVDTLIENNIKARGKLINDEVKKNLTEATYTTAKQIECISYLFANLITFYGVFNNNKRDIIEFSKKY